MTPKPKPRGTVHVDATAAWRSAPVFVGDGHVVPSSIPAWAELPDGTTVGIDIEVTPESARAVKLTVQSGRGIGWATLANVPIRDIVATAVLTVLKRATLKPDESFALALPANAKERDAAWAVMRALVGYKPNVAGLKVAS